MPGPPSAVGFLFHAETRSVLLHLRGSDAPSNPNMWHLFGGRGEEADRGDPVAIWQREMREELGVSLERHQAIRLWDRDVGWTQHVFYCEWPSLCDQFEL